MRSPELYNLICAAAGAADVQATLNRAALSADAWAQFGELALARGAAPWLYWRFEAQGWPDAAPPVVRQRLLQAYLLSSAHNALLFQELDKLLAIFETAGIAVTLLKGAALARSVYPDAATRPMTDLDVLLRARDLPGAVRLLEKQGYTRQKVIYHVLLEGGPGQRVNLELHWNLPVGGAQPGQVAWLWQQRRKIAPNGWGLSPEATLLYLCAHLALQHGADTPYLPWLLDLRQVVQAAAGSFDWPAFLLAAQQQHLQGAARQALGAATQRLGDFTAPGILEALSAGVGSQAQASVQPRAVRTRSAFSLLPWPVRLSLGTGLLFPRREYILRHYHPRPAWAWPLYYLKRWVDLLTART